MAITPLQSARAVASTNVTIALTTTAGSFLVAYVGSSTTGRTASASDNVNGAYNTDQAAASSCSICTFPSNAGGALTVTGTVSGAAGVSIDMIVEEWPANTVLTPTPFDKGTTGTASVTNTLTTSTTATLSAATELVLAVCCLNGTAGTLPYAIQGAYTVGPSSPNPNTVNAIMATGYQFLSSNAGVNANFTWTTNNTARAALATYKLVPSGAGSVPTFTLYGLQPYLAQ